MGDVKFDLEISTVQELCNEIENKIINVVDKIAPMSTFSNNQLQNSTNYEIKSVYLTSNKCSYYTNWVT